MSGVIESRLRRCSHCAAKLVTSARDRSSASIRRTCRSSTAGSCSFPRCGHVEQLVVRNAAPQEERQPRRQLEIADAIRRVRRDARPDPARRGTGTAGLTSTRRQRHLDARVEVAVRARLPIERERALQIGVGHRPPIGPPHQRRRESVLRGRVFLVPALAGLRHEDPAAARRVAGPLRRVRTDDRDRVDRRLDARMPIRIEVRLVRLPLASRAASDGFFRNVTPTSCGPAVTGTRIFRC